MKFSISAALVACSFVVLTTASPLRKKVISGTTVSNDVTILNFALTLEHLEAEFYKQGLARFGEADFRRANVPSPTQAFQNFHHILQHEVQHVETLKKVIRSLGGTPVPPCEYRFPFNTVTEFTRLASTLEKVGVSAYNGAVALLQNRDLQTAAAAIDTVEARHASFLQTVNGHDPFPASFDTPLDGRQIVTLAAPVIKSCPFDLGFAPFGALRVDAEAVNFPGRDIKVDFQKARGPYFCNFLHSDESTVVPLTNGNACRVPENARGDILLMITNSNQQVRLRKTDIIVAGPVIIVIDTAHGDSCAENVGNKDVYQRNDRDNNRHQVDDRNNRHQADDFNNRHQDKYFNNNDHQFNGKDHNNDHQYNDYNSKHDNEKDGEVRASSPVNAFESSSSGTPTFSASSEPEEIRNMMDEVTRLTAEESAVVSIVVPSTPQVIAPTTPESAPTEFEGVPAEFEDAPADLEDAPVIEATAQAATAAPETPEFSFPVINLLEGATAATKQYDELPVLA